MNKDNIIFTFDVDPFGSCKVQWIRSYIDISNSTKKFLVKMRLVTVCLISPIGTDLCYQGTAIKNPADEDNMEYGHELSFQRAYDNMVKDTANE